MYTLNGVFEVHSATQRAEGQSLDKEEYGGEPVSNPQPHPDRFNGFRFAPHLVKVDRDWALTAHLRVDAEHNETHCGSRWIGCIHSKDTLYRSQSEHMAIKREMCTQHRVSDNLIFSAVNDISSDDPESVPIRFWALNESSFIRCPGWQFAPDPIYKLTLSLLWRLIPVSLL